MNFRFCLIVPCYEAHALQLESTLEGLVNYPVDLIVVDDGSSKEYADKIKNTCLKFKAKYLVNPMNGGKGAAIKTGIQYAYENKYTHALQVDADGQHDTSILNKLISASKKSPKAVISGKPIYDESVPKGRLYGRYLTHVWIWIETLSFSVKDSMCGFRSYPVEATFNIISKYKVGERMDFDPEILVRLYWSGVNINFIPTQVIYPEGGASYFNVVKDNILISKMHTRLFFGMLIRFPMIILRNYSGGRWSNIDEKGAVTLIKFTSWMQDFFGEKFILFVLKIISFYYFLFAFNARESSKQFRKIYKEYCDKKQIKFNAFNSFDHIYSFARIVIEKFSVWKGGLTLDKFNSEDVAKLRSLKSQKSGALFISSHFGNIELIRALGLTDQNIKYSALVYMKNSQKMFNILEQIDPSVKDNIIPIENFGADVGLLLEKKIENGEWIFCMADRMAADSEKAVSNTLLGRDVELPLGPFVMAYLLNAQIYSIHCYREGSEFRIQTREITPDIERKRVNRKEFMQSVANEYVKDLEEVLVKEPTQWFNFYKYWKED